ncbi:bifunctional serine/threonine-protein kinase/formylglycine-generating enzyme family protein [Glaciecola petra]|uniref:Bifunctional serine/threonine-protein kinase/formylglycine-generating enzyme family protein n=1 Tax=Glaciecola petra TaxID=3075602 RepID=A0ABU2ZRI1_9ALTE|nr:bifunctional serine/threonine-protein kinase/formylglycine-generating enzyme family protein [Aestuariibacter sp. P117]MDT0594052.1 bifunctional serine/threonine-protein kinase/formylglycine-generating enzyme family protein [Aestuariibacter sp. P117]
MYQKGDFIDAYQVLEQLFVGENSQIYLVYCQSLNCNLVIKCAYVNNSDQASNNHAKDVNDSFIYQARLMHHFSNEEHIVRLMHIGNVEHTPYILMPLYQQNLAEYMASSGDRISAYKSISFIKQVLSAINSLHDKGVLHLDVKPQNILLDENLKVYLGDFDAAYVFNNHQLITNVNALNITTKFTHEYASPEVKKGNQDLSEGADLYSIGVLWCRLLLGGGALNRLNNKDEREELISSLSPTVPKWMVDLIKALLASNPDKRPKSARVCLDLIEKHTQNAESFQTIVMTDDSLMSTLSMALSSEIEKILLAQGKLNKHHAIDLCASIKSEQDKVDIKDIFTLEAAVKQQLILNKNLQKWFEWCDLVDKKAQIYANHKKIHSSVEEFEKLLEDGQQSRPDNPQAALLLLQLKVPKQAAMLSNVSKPTQSYTNAKSLKFIVSVLVILFVFAYWTLSNYFMLDKHSEDKSEPIVTVFKEDVSDTMPPKANQSTSSEQLVLGSFLPQENRVLIDIVTAKGEIEKVSLINISSAAPADKSITLNVPFFVMESEVSRALYNLCVADGSCSKSKTYSTLAKRESIEQPMTNVSWYEVNQQFIPWMNTKVNGQFKLPNLEQWKLFALWPQSIASFTQLKQNSHCKNCGNTIARTTRFFGLGRPNELGLYDVYGNVQEWLSECWYDNGLERCDQAIVAGGSWYNEVTEIQQNHMNRLLKQAKTPTTGFRLIYYPNE